MKQKHSYVRERWQDEEKPGTVYYVLRDKGKVVVFYGGLYEKWTQEMEDKIQAQFYVRMNHYIDTHNEIGILDLKKVSENTEDTDQIFHRMIKGRKMKKEILSLNQ